MGLIDDIKLRMAKLSDTELIGILRDDDQYTDEALNIAKEELIRRNISLDNVAEIEVSRPNIESLDEVSFLASLYGFNGKIGRLKYFYSNIVVILFGYVLYFISAWVGVKLLTILTIIIIVYCQISIAVKRLHDLGKSGYMTLLLFVPIFNLIPITIMLFMPGELYTSSKYSK